MNNKKLKAFSILLTASVLFSGAANVYAATSSSNGLDLSGSGLAFDVDKFMKDGKATSEEILGSMDINHMMTLQLGASPLAIEVPDTFVEGDKTNEDVADGLVAYYYSDEMLLDFDVYEISKTEDVPDTLEAFVIADAAASGAIDINKEDIHGYPVMSYTAIEEDAGVTYTTITYTTETNNEYIQVVFWLDGEHAKEDADYIMDTLNEEEWKELPLGESCYSITIPYDYQEGFINVENRDEDGQVGYYFSKSSLLDFDIYLFSNFDVADTLEGYLEEEASEYDGTNLRIEEINGIEVASYDAVEMSGDRGFHTSSHIMADGDNYVEIVFWRDGVVAEKQADAILKTITKN